MPETKILQIVVGLDIGGIEMFLSKLVPQLNDEKYKITICVLKKRGPVVEIFEKNGIKVTALNARNKFSIGILIKLFKMIRKENFQIVQSQLFFANILAACTVLFYRIFTFQMSSPTLILNQRELGDWHRPYHTLLLRWASFVSDKFICCSEEVRRIVTEKFKVNHRKCITILNGINLKEFDSGSEQFDKGSAQKIELDAIFPNRNSGIYIVGAMGRLFSREKGWPYLIEAIFILKKEKQRQFQLILAGDGLDRRRLETLVNQFELEDCIKFVGNQSNSAYLMKRFDLFVLPSITEGFPNTVLEAMASGLPVVATRIGGIPELVIDKITGILVPSRDSAALAGSIEYMITHPKEASEMGRRGRARVEEKFTMDKTIQAYETLYDQMVHLEN